MLLRSDWRSTSTNIWWIVIRGYAAAHLNLKIKSKETEMNRMTVKDRGESDTGRYVQLQSRPRKIGNQWLKNDFWTTYLEQAISYTANIPQEINWIQRNARLSYISYSKVYSKMRFL